MDKVEAIWLDSISFANEWMNEDAVRALVGRECRTRGYLVHRDKDFIRIAQSRFNGDYHNIMLIPAGAVKRLIKK